MVAGCPVFNFVTAAMGRGNPDFGDHNTFGVHFSARPGIDYGSPGTEWCNFHVASGERDGGITLCTFE